jgi:molecular chaperone Hsp33
MRGPDLDPGDVPAGISVPVGHDVPEDDAWIEGRALVETVEDLELIDPALSSERLLYRLFHERGVRVFRSASVQARCSCSREGVAHMLTRFSPSERRDMAEDGMISVTCEFCNGTYRFAPAELEED